jgi:hypothetical protein
LKTLCNAYVRSTTSFSLVKFINTFEVSGCVAMLGFFQTNLNESMDNHEAVQSMAQMLAREARVDNTLTWAIVGMLAAFRDNPEVVRGRACYFLTTDSIAMFSNETSWHSCISAFHGRGALACLETMKKTDSNHF